MLSIVLAVLAAAASATASVLQRKAASESSGGGSGAGLLRNLARKPVWFGGVAAIVVGFGLHTAALATGPISLVQPILVLELGFALLLAAAVFHSKLHAREWTAVAGMTAGLALLLYSARPSGGDPGAAPTTAWVVGIAVTLGLAALFGWRARRRPDDRRPPARRPAYLGVATGLGFGLTATLVAAVTSAYGRGGVEGVLTTWQTYLLVVLGPAAFLSLQRTLQAGRLVASQPAVTLSNPVVGFGFGIGVFGEQIRAGGWLVGTLVGVALVAVCTVLLARSPLLNDVAPARRVGARRPV